MAGGGGRGGRRVEEGRTVAGAADVEAVNKAWFYRWPLNTLIVQSTALSLIACSACAVRCLAVAEMVGRSHSQCTRLVKSC